MNVYFVAAASLAVLVGFVHSVMGEILIFHQMRQGRFIPTNGGERLRERHVRILWASWHFLTVLGWGMAALLVWLARLPSQNHAYGFIAYVVVVCMALGAALVFIGTRARHPGWIGLLGVAVLTWLGQATGSP